jgi:hypothetical protein
VSSFIIFAKTTFHERVPLERRHTQYDEELGWINLPDVYVKDMYGPGKDFRTNSMMFRNNKEFSHQIPAGKIRLLCSGDSFTLGYGVDNDSTWCQQLESNHSGLETVNLGQGGYGIDQTYLWFKRNVAKLDYDVQIFAFISDDFARMQRASFSGYGKPLLVLENGSLVNKNRPVPSFAYRFPRSVILREEIANLNLVRILRGIALRLAPVEEQIPTQRETHAGDVVLSILTDVKQVNQARASVAVFVFLPDSLDYIGHRESEHWRSFLKAASVKHQFLFIDLVDDLRTVAPDNFRVLFGDNGHYSEEGNRFAANVLYHKLAAIPEIQSKLQEVHPH